LYALTNPSLKLGGILFIGYIVALVFHSVFYLMELQPHRTIAFVAGAARHAPHTDRNRRRAGLKCRC
jgi:hypothetical protein